MDTAKPYWKIPLTRLKNAYAIWRQNRQNRRTR